VGLGKTPWGFECRGIPHLTQSARQTWGTHVRWHVEVPDQNSHSSGLLSRIR
jgi:hypothetical protein